MNSETANLLQWSENNQARQALWQTDNGARRPTRIQICTDLDPAQAHRLASAGTGLLWRGTYPQARQLLQGMAARMDAANLRQRQQQRHRQQEVRPSRRRRRKGRVGGS